MGGKYLSQFNGNVKLYFYNTVDKKTPTAKKGTNLAVGLSRTKVQETLLNKPLKQSSQTAV